VQSLSPKPDAVRPAGAGRSTDPGPATLPKAQGGLPENAGRTPEAARGQRPDGGRGGQPETRHPVDEGRQGPPAPPNPAENPGRSTGTRDGRPRQPAPPRRNGAAAPGLQGGIGTLKASVPAKVRLLEINLHCTGDRDSDKQLMRKVYQMLEQRPGPDRFLFNIISDKGRVQLDFPNATTHFEAELENALRQTLGDDALYVQWTEA
jgi:hypothetical protein